MFFPFVCKLAAAIPSCIATVVHVSIVALTEAKIPLPPPPYSNSPPHS